MKKKVGIIKRRLAVLLIVALSITSFGSIVSDNDGSAFITKAEFDALKASFQSQIDSYNTSIDSKIDGAIAAYLAGIRVNDKEDRKLEYFSSSGVPMMDNNAPLRYQLGYSYAHGICGNIISQKVPSTPARNFVQLRLINFQGVEAYWNGVNPKPFKKLLISNVDNTKKFANWTGYGTDCRENLVLGTGLDYRTSLWWNQFNQATTSEPIISLNATAVSSNEWNLNGPNYAGFADVYGFNFFENFNNYFKVQSLSAKTNVIEKQNLCVFSNANCYEFQNSDIVPGCAWTSYCAWSNLTTTKQNWVNCGSDIISNDEVKYLDWFKNSLEPANNACVEAVYDSSFSATELKHRIWNNVVHWVPRGWTGRYVAPLVQTFDSVGSLNAWKQIYQEKYDNVADYYSGSLPNAILTTSDGQKHLAITGGFPLFETKKGEKIDFVISGKNSEDLPLYVWIKTRPFDLTQKPQDESKTNFLNISGNNGATFDNTAKALKIVNNNTKISFEIPETEIKGAWLIIFSIF